MDRLQLLIRLARQTVDERQSELGNLCRVREEADVALATHEGQVANEYAFAGENLHSLATFGAWTAFATRRSALLKDRRAELGRVEGAARDSLREALADSRRLEMALESAERTARKVEARKVQNRADASHMLLASMSIDA